MTRGKRPLLFLVVALRVLGLSAEDGRVLQPEESVTLGSLPNGVRLLPDFDQRRNCVFSFGEAKLSSNPYAGEERPKSREEFFRRLQKERTGDVIYDDAEGGSLVICSNQVQFLGQGLLSELPEDLKPKLEEREFLRATPGGLYLLRCVDRKRNYAVFRVLSVSKQGCRIQWLYQRDGSCRFGIDGPLLDRKMGTILMRTRGIRGVVMQLERHRIRVCLEPTAHEKDSDELGKIHVRNATVKSLLDAVTAYHTNYDWRKVKGTDVVCVFPRKGSRLNVRVNRDAVEPGSAKGSWIDIVKSLHHAWKDVLFPPIQEPHLHLWRPEGRDKEISLVIAREDTILDVLGKICYAHGDNMRFDLVPSRRVKTKWVLRFVTDSWRM